MPTHLTRPVLIYDGDCSFCRTWVGFWQSLTGDALEYLPLQQASERFPDVSVEDCLKAVQFITNEGRFSGAEGVCRFLAGVPGYSWLFWCYRFLPGFAFIANVVYRFIANHRSPAFRFTRALWGSTVRRSEYHVASEIFSRALAIIYAVAFFSFLLQARGLVGSEGILPARAFLEAVYQQLGPAAMWRLPTLFWWGNADVTILSIAAGGGALAFVSLLTKPHSLWQRFVFVLLWAYYLSIVNAGQVFMSYQWDWLLVEVGFLAIFLKPVSSRVWLFRWLLFRLIFESGIVKLLSHDPTWHNLTALNFHYWTQPIPTPLAWYMNLLPEWFQKLSVVVVFIVELALPFLIFAPRRLKQLAGFGIIALQSLIILTGNYTFFNLLTIALCLFLYDDAFFARWKLKPKPATTPASAPGHSKWPTRRLFPRSAAETNRPPKPIATGLLWAVIVFLSAIDLGGLIGKVPQPFTNAASQISQFGIVNRYGLFAVMTTQRMEIQIEASADGEKWEPYLFHYKPGPLNRALPWVEPHQPRLDWQMWFAALGNARQNPWFVNTLVGLLRGSKPVNGLFAQLPLAGATPKLIRASVYEYHFTTWDEHSKTGNYWKREYKGLYFPAVGIRAGQ